MILIGVHDSSVFDVISSAEEQNTEQFVGLLKALMLRKRSVKDRESIEVSLLLLLLVVVVVVVSVYLSAYVCTNIYIYIYMYIYIHTYIHTYMHTYIHTYTYKRSVFKEGSLRGEITQRKRAARDEISSLYVYVYGYGYGYIEEQLPICICIYTCMHICIYNMYIERAKS